MKLHLRERFSTHEGMHALIKKKGSINPTMVLGLILALVLTYLIAIPVVMLITESVRVHSIDVSYFQQEEGAFTLRYFQRALASRVSSVLFLSPLVNTLVIATCITLCTTIVGYILAWVITRTDIRLKKIFASARCSAAFFWHSSRA